MNSDVFRFTQESTDRFAVGKPQKPTCFSACGSVRRIARRFGGISLRLRELIKRPEIAGRIRTISDPKSDRAAQLIPARSAAQR
jgi:hypothetical protein